MLVLPYSVINKNTAVVVVGVYVKSLTMEQLAKQFTALKSEVARNDSIKIRRCNSAAG